VIWDESSRARFESLVLRQGPRKVARAVGCDPKTVYRWINGENAPMLAYRRTIIRILDMRDCDTRNARGRGG